MWLLSRITNKDIDRKKYIEIFVLTNNIDLFGYHLVEGHKTKTNLHHWVIWSSKRDLLFYFILMSSLCLLSFL